MTLLRSRTEEVIRGRSRALQELARGAPLSQVLMTLTRSAEEAVPSLRCSLLLLDAERKRFRSCIAPSLPDWYAGVADGVEIGPDVGSCGAAAALRRRVVCEDVRVHPNWTRFLDIAERAHIRAAWSEPVLSSTGDVLGTFAMYYSVPRRPEEFELEFIETTAHLAGIAIEHRHTLESLWNNEARIRAIVNTAIDGIVTLDAEGHIQSFNPAAERLFGYRADEIMGVGIELLMPCTWQAREGRPRIGEFLESAASEEGGVRLEVRGLRKDGTSFPIELAVSEHCVGTERRLTGILRDVTERKEFEQSLADGEERFRQLAESIREVFWLTDWKAMRVLYVSPAYEAIWRRPCQELYDRPKSWSADIHPDDRARVTESFLRDSAEGRYDVEYRLMRDDGSVVWIHDRAFPIKDEHGVTYRVAGISEDITESKEVMLALKAARDELAFRSSEKLRSLTSELLLAEERERRRLAEDLHDGLNQTITLARMKIGALRRRLAGEDAKRLDEIAALVDDANHSARTLTFQLSPPILHDLGFESAVQWLVEDVERSYGLSIVLVEDGPPCDLDERVRVLLFRAVRELLINVAKHAEARSVRIGVQRGDMLRITVRDDGKAFDARSTDGRGLGLSSIRERLDHLGGRMTIHSELGRGTEVTLVAPVEVGEVGEEEERR